MHNLKIIPYVILYLAVDLIYCNIHDGVRFADGIKAIFTDIFTLSTTFSNTLHLWYIYIFVIIVLIKPLLAQITCFLDKTRTWRAFVILNFIVIVWNDFSNNALLTLSHHSINALFPSVLVMLLGNGIYKIRDKFKARHCLIALTVFAAVNILRSFAVYKTYGSTGSIHLLFWFSSFGIISSAALCVFMLALPQISSVKAKAAINYIGSLTMCVYLFHPLVITALSAKGVLADLQETIIKSNRFLCLAAYTLIATLAVFAISVAVSAAINIISVCIKKISNIKQRRKNG